MNQVTGIPHIILLLTAFEVNTGSYCPGFIRIDRAIARSIRINRGQYEPVLTEKRLIRGLLIDFKVAFIKKHVY